jgi:hypothetical protein
METKTLKKLLSRIAVNRFVNLHFDGQKRDYKTIREIIKEIKEKQKKSYCIDINIKQIPSSDKKAVSTLLNIINKELSEYQFKHCIHEAISIAHVLEQLNERLEKPALIIFHQFKTPDKKDNKFKKEKNLLTHIRKFIQMKSSLLLGILIISSHPVHTWDLSPYSNLDERYVEYFL